MFDVTIYVIYLPDIRTLDHLTVENTRTGVFCHADGQMNEFHSFYQSNP